MNQDRQPSPQAALSVRPNISTMHGYVPGEQLAGGKWIKLNTNENPYRQAPSVDSAIRTAVEQGLYKYPDPLGTSFRLAASSVLQVPPEWILCGNGSDDILTILTRSLVGEGGLLRFPYPSYILYRTLAELQGARFEEVPFTDDWSLPNSVSDPTAGPNLVVIPNPNSPTGTCVPLAGLRSLAQSLTCPLLIDEAYADFADNNCLDLVREFPHVMVCRTLSKSYGLAGLRFGYLVARPDWIEQFRKVKDSYNCDSLSLAGATAAIADQAWLKQNVQRVQRERTELTTGLRALGFDVLESQANFVWCTHPKHSAKSIYEGLKQRQILVRYMDYPQWQAGLRISVGTPEQTNALLAVLKEQL